MLSIFINLSSCPSNNFTYNMKACSNNFISQCKFRLTELTLLLKLVSRNLRSISVLTYFQKDIKISLNMAIKEPKQISSVAFTISKITRDRPLAFPLFILLIACCTSWTSILHTPPTTLLAAILPPFIFNIDQSFHVSFQMCF